ncbi:transmembrane protein 216-like [Trichogramma pretiosum]|uniref:Transmembrane protein 216 n=1 Tax=Trichogramma kaykai TaxID=54128 RepID=A0ABD2X3K2_9HYME|nr:transmembrane protein 216-like [Trichogramma pretiosum]
MPSASQLSLIYQVLLYLNGFYFSMFAICEFCIKIVKTYSFQASFTNVTTEFAVLFLFVSTEVIRNLLGKRGNLLDHGLPFLFGLFLIVPSILSTLYFLFWQDRTLRLEQILCIIQLIFFTVEASVGMLFLCVVWKRPPPEG